MYVLFFLYLCSVKKNAFFGLFIAVLLLFGCTREVAVDPLKRAVVDGLNKEAFVNRYRQPDTCIALSQRALAYIADSLPTYADGALRAYNNMAFAYYQMSDYPAANRALEKLNAASGNQKVANGEIEGVIGQLLRARLLQRECRLADSYRLLYDIGRSRTLDRNRDNLLYNYALTEYYITLLTLNFHYRDGKEADIMQLVNEVEQRRSTLRVDYAQDMALNYALAYGLQSAGESTRALDYCDLNFDILERNTPSFCLYHYANTVQMTAYVLRSVPGAVTPDSVLALYDLARECFFKYGDPYQMLGGVTSTARYALLIGDTAKAHQVLTDWRALRGTWTPFAAPKMEVGYFDVLIRSGIANDPAENLRWYVHRCELQDYIARNEKEDFILQNSLDIANRRSRWMTAFAVVLGALLVVLLVLFIVLWNTALRLRREKHELQEAKRRDVERIANVETCLSVMRHDVSPFMGYLSNPSLSDELRAEVTGQLLRTFDNLKEWTRLSAPKGLMFNAKQFALQEVFDSVRLQVIKPNTSVELRIEPTPLILWADPLLVTILLRNLVNNALQHTDNGEVRVACSEWKTEDGFVEITVADTGSGMTPEQVERLFSADRQMAGTNEGSSPLSGGHGFGLILCRYIVKCHDDNTRRGCKIWAESQLGQGTVMHVLLAAGR